jgi:hypothetical protein
MPLWYVDEEPPNLSALVAALREIGTQQFIPFTSHERLCFSELTMVSSGILSKSLSVATATTAIWSIEVTRAQAWLRAS